MRTFKYLSIILLAFMFDSCSDFLEPNMDNYKSEEVIERAKNDFMGVLYVTYESLPKRIDFTY